MDYRLVHFKFHPLSLCGGLLSHPDLWRFIEPLLINQRLMHRFSNEPRADFARDPDCLVIGFIEPHQGISSFVVPAPLAPCTDADEDL